MNRTSLTGDSVIEMLRVARARAGDLGADAPETGDNGGAAATSHLEQQFQFLHRELPGYDLLNPIRRGGQGLVFRARQHRPNRIVALKVLLDGPLATDRQRYRFEREIELIARLNHPNIVTLYETGVVHGRLYFTMEFVQGMPVDEYVILNDLRPKQVVRLMRKVCDAVHHAHQQGIIHRDLNPANILVDESGEPHVFDFGLASDLVASSEGALSCTGQILGTLPYLSPEQAGGLDGKTDVRSDVYALGLILYHLLTDSFPYDVSGNPHEVRSSIVSSDPIQLIASVTNAPAGHGAAVREINRDLSAIVAKALNKPKDLRYQSVAALAADLDEYTLGKPVTAARPGLLRHLRAAVRKHKTAAAVLATLAIAFAVGTTAVTFAWLEALEQRDKARLAAFAAYGAFDLALQEVEQSVRPLPGGLAVRDQLLQALSAELPALEQIAADTELAEVTAGLSERRGDILSTQGHRAAAAVKYRQFLDLALALRASDETNVEYADQVTRALGKLAGVSDDPEPWFEQAIDSARQAVVRTPDRDEAVYAAAHVLVEYAAMLKDDAAYESALVQIDQAIELVPAELADLHWLRLAATAWSLKGRLLVHWGDAEEGVESIERSLKLREEIVGMRPVDVEALRDLVLARAHAARLRRSAGDGAAAKTLLVRALQEADRLAAMDPSATSWDRERFAMRHDLSTLMLDLRDEEAALDHCTTAIALAERLVEANATYSEQLSFALVLEGRILLDAGRISEARDDFERALSLRQQAVLAAPEEIRGQQLLADANYWVGRILRNTEGPTAALTYYHESHSILGDVVTKHPDVAGYLLDFIDAKISLASLHLECQTELDDGAAREYLRAAEYELQQLHQRGSLAGLDADYARRAQAIESNRRVLNIRATQ